MEESLQQASKDYVVNKQREVGTIFNLIRDKTRDKKKHVIRELYITTIPGSYGIIHNSV